MQTPDISQQPAHTHDVELTDFSRDIKPAISHGLSEAALNRLFDETQGLGQE